MLVAETSQSSPENLTQVVYSFERVHCSQRASLRIYFYKNDNDSKEPYHTSELFRKSKLEESTGH